MRAVIILVCCTVSNLALEASETEGTEGGITEEFTIDSKAASRKVNCNCQCSNIQFKDKYGRTNGNCQSADTSGALWCYVEPIYAQCSDLKRSDRVNQFFSYEACATPDLTSQVCRGGYGGPSNGGFNNGGFNSGSNNGGFNNGGINSGSNNGGFNNGGFNSGSNNGGFNNGGYNNGRPVGSNGFNNNFGLGTRVNEDKPAEPSETPVGEDGVKFGQ